MERTSESGFPIDPVYDASKLTDFQPEAKLGRPGEYPFTRGVYPRMALAAGPGGPQAPWLAVRTQQVIARESGLTATVDPFAGSCAVEAMTDEIEAAAGALMDRIEEMGGAAAAIERGFQKAGIESAAYQVAREIDEGDRIVVGVNKFATDGEEPYQPLRVDPAIVTLGEVCDALRVVWDEYHPSEM
jgi:methylmalonyl-CoA mutase N-terminal domain/subunit